MIKVRTVPAQPGFDLVTLEGCRADGFHFMFRPVIAWVVETNAGEGGRYSSCRVWGVDIQGNDATYFQTIRYPDGTIEFTEHGRRFGREEWEAALSHAVELFDAENKREWVREVK